MGDRAWWRALLMDDNERTAIATLLEAGNEASGELPSAAAVHESGRALLARLGISRPAPLPARPADEEVAEAPEELLYWLVTMAGHTYERASEPAPAVDPALLARLETLLARRPEPDDAYCQMPIDAASTLRRAQVALSIARALQGGREAIMAIGDDDAVSLALLLLGAENVHVADVDGDLLDFLADSASAIGGGLMTHEVDLFAEELPPSLSRAFDVVLTDPIRSYGPCLAFLDVSERCLAATRRARILWADHPDWNFELDRVIEALPALGLRLDERHPLLHRYPLAPVWVRDLADKARALGVPAQLLEGLARHVSGYTDLLSLARVTQAAT